MFQWAMTAQGPRQVSIIFRINLHFVPGQFKNHVFKALGHLNGERWLGRDDGTIPFSPVSPWSAGAGFPGSKSIRHAGCGLQVSMVIVSFLRGSA